MNLEALQKKFNYVQVRDKYDILKAHELLEKIGVKVLNDDAHKIKVMNLDDSRYKSNSFNGFFYIIKDGDGWKIQSHFIGTENTIDELEEDVYLYLRGKSKSEMTDEEREKNNKVLTDLNKRIQSILCYVHLNYKDDSDIKSIISQIKNLSDRISKRYDVSFEDFTKRDDFESMLMAFLRENKINQIFD
jgi:hypothetical protein